MMSDAVIIALIAVVPSLIAAVTTIITTIFANREKKKRQLDEQVNKVSKEVGEKVDNMKEFLYQSINDVNTRLQNHIDSDNISTRVLLRHNIDQMYDKFMAQGYITLKESEEVFETYDAYKSLGGNHTGEEKYKAIMALPRR